MKRNSKMMRVVILFFLCMLLFQINYCKTLPTNSVMWNYSPDGTKKLQTDNDIFHLIEKEPAKNDHPNNELLIHIYDFLKIKNLIRSIGSRVQGVSTCLSCKFAVAFLQQYAKGGASENDIASLVYKICTLFHIEKPPVCAGVTKLFKREVIMVLVKVALNPDEFCGIIIPNCGNVINPLHNWTVPMTPFPKPPVRPPPPPKPGSPITRVLHISDVHVDLLYKEGTNANCGEPLCCRKSSGEPSTPADASGFWGDYRNCDTPLRTLENMLAHINKTHKIDYVIWTGDIPPHDIWNNSRQEAVYLLHSTSRVIQQYLGDVPIFPALGNHESSPVNSFPIPQITGNDSISWLYNEVAKAWSNWLPNSSSTLKLGAYYSVQVYKGFRIISLNMNYCNNMNWWLLLNSTDPTGELAWLVTELQKAEDIGEKVHIIGHIPPGQFDCLAVWSSNYYRIVNRYESTITAQFFGHTHKDEFELFYDKSGLKPRATSIAYVGPSVTTYSGINPGYRIYTVDGNYPESSRVVLDHESYYLNLTEANIYKKPIWRFEYSAKQAYNMSSLLPADWDALTYRFEKDDELFQHFYRFYKKLSDFSPIPCDRDCKKTLLCELRRAQSNDPLTC